jgi:hypothetical protein
MISLLSKYRNLTPFICKVEIEGAESGLFEDASWVDEFPALIVELHEWLLPKERRSGTFLEAVANRDRDFIVFRENIVSVKNC